GFDTLENAQATEDDQAQLPASAARNSTRQRCAFQEVVAGLVNLLAHEFAPGWAVTRTCEVVGRHTLLPEFVQGNVESSALPVDGDVLAEVGQLQSCADVVGPLQVA